MCSATEFSAGVPGFSAPISARACSMRYFTVFLCSIISPPVRVKLAPESGKTEYVSLSRAALSECAANSPSCSFTQSRNAGTSELSREAKATPGSS